MSFDQQSVVAFYEEHPYPYRPPGAVPDDTLIGVPADMRFINHYVFGGRRDFARPMRVLVAGGGTGDAVVGLGRQLRQLGCPAEIVYIDLSTRSREIAEARARGLGLTGVTFHTGSILDLPGLGVGAFDYIDFCGVINHVGDQQGVLDVLAGLLAPGGGIGMMAYGIYGRTGVYEMQRMLRLVDCAPEDVATVRRLFDSLPAENWLKRNPVFAGSAAEPDVELADRYLVPADRAFTVLDLDAHARTAGLDIAAFLPPMLYDPLRHVADAGLRDRLAKRSWIERCAFAEMHDGNIPMHNLYLVQAGRRPGHGNPMEDKASIPTLIGLPYGQAPRLENNSFSMNVSFGPLRRSVVLPATPMTPHILHALDGRKTLGKIHREMPGNVSWRHFLRDFAVLFQGLNGIGSMVLSTTPMPP
jgi:SAM-dependent methyltransferase